MGRGYDPAAKRVDPDPLVIDLLLQVGVAAVAGLLARLPFEAVHALRQRRSHATQGQLEQLREFVGTLESQIESAMRIVDPGTKRTLGVPLLLSQDTLVSYDSLRDEIFSQIRSVDELSRSIFGPQADVTGEGEPKPPKEFRTHLKTIEKRMRDAQAASTSEEAFLEMKQAVVVMRRMLDRIESKG